jgi:hypothetical protein
MSSRGIAVRIIVTAGWLLAALAFGRHTMAREPTAGSRPDLRDRFLPVVRHGRETDAYFSSFLQQRQVIRRDHLDAEFHGVCEMIDQDGHPTVPGKGRIWKAAYHDGRALLNVSERLRRLAQSAAR